MVFTALRAETEQNLRQDRLSFSIFLFSVLSVLAQSSLILTASGSLPPQIPLFYSEPWGETMLTQPAMLWILPAICVLVTGLNFSLAIFLLKENRFLVRTLTVFSLIVALATLYDTAKIISLLT